VTRVLGKPAPFCCIPRARGRLPLPPDETPTHVSSCGLFVIYTGLRILPEGVASRVEKEGRRWRGFVQGRRVDEEICHTLGWGFRNPDFR
jgi:hypothetical protein